jgi:hypothetical protein
MSNGRLYDDVPATPRFINGVLSKCPWEFKKEQGIWYKRPKNSRSDWEIVTY